MDGEGDSESIGNRINEIKSLIENSDSEYDIENTAGLAEITDVTEEVLLRLGRKP